MKNKYYIVTFQNAYNYGAILQCLALQHSLQSLNKNVAVINYNNDVIGNFYSIFYKPKNVNLFTKYIKCNISSIIYFKKIFGRNKKFKQFIKDNINLTKKMSKEEIINFPFQNGDCVIVGSDQVWNTSIIEGTDDVYFLNLKNKCKKVSYAASIGTSKIESQYIDYINNSLGEYDLISVREETAKEELNKIIDKKIEVVLDPTLLLDKKEWKQYFNESKTIKDDYIFSYMSNPELDKIILDVANKENLKVVNVFKKNLYGNYEINCFESSPAEFLNLIYNAKYVFTTSYHATIFSILFEKKFWVMPPKNVSSRITDLLKKINLSNRIILEYQEMENEELKENIKYDKVIQKIDIEKEKSIKFIEKL